MTVYIYIYIYMCVCVCVCVCVKSYVQELPQEKAVLLPVKSLSDDDPGFRHAFGAEASLPLTQGAQAVSHNTTRLYWMVFDLYECHIRSDAVTLLFWVFFFIYSLFFAAESPSLVKNVQSMHSDIKYYEKDHKLHEIYFSGRLGGGG